MRTNDKLRRLTLTALFAAAITLTTAYLFHIPIPTGGYVHLGDALVYLAACLLPAPYAMAAAAVGAGLADLLTAPAWVIPTVLIKPLVALLFTGVGGGRVLCPRSCAAVAAAGVLSPTAYALAGCAMAGSMAPFLPQFLGTLAQGLGSGIVFLALAPAVPRLSRALAPAVPRLSRALAPGTPARCFEKKRSKKL